MSNTTDIDRQLTEVDPTVAEVLETVQFINERLADNDAALVSHERQEQLAFETGDWTGRIHHHAMIERIRKNTNTLRAQRRALLDAAAALRS